MTKKQGITAEQTGLHFLVLILFDSSGSVITVPKQYGIQEFKGCIGQKLVAMCHHTRLKTSP